MGVGDTTKDTFNTNPDHQNSSISYKSQSGVQRQSTSKGTTEGATDNSVISLKPIRTRRPDRDIYIPRARRSQTTPRSFSKSLKNAESTNSPGAPVREVKRRSDPESYQTGDNKSNLVDAHIGPNEQKPENLILLSKCETNNLRNISLVKQNTIDNSDCDLISESYCNTYLKGIETDMASPKKLDQLKSIEIESVATNNQNIKDERNHEENELRKVSKEMNRPSRRIIKQTFNSDVLEIGTQEAVLDNYDSSTITSTKKVDIEEDDWESMYDDSGDCLDPKIMDELTAQVGKVNIEKPKTDYKVYQTKQALLLEEEFPHVLEASNFPIEFKTQDLMMTFSAYKESGFDIKWVDDTHALIVFSNTKIAADVLSTNHAFVKVKPLKEATTESRNKAKKCSASLQPYRQRPETCAALARRLVTGALGVRLKTAREERENERRILNEARKRKLLAAKQSEEIWES